VKNGGFVLSVNFQTHLTVDFDQNPAGLAVPSFGARIDIGDNRRKIEC